MKKIERNFKGVWIPAEIWLHKDLTVMEKLFMVEIDSLDNANGCFASNAYFGDFFGLSNGRCSQIINSLHDKKLISLEYERAGKSVKKRIIKVFNKLNRGYLENYTPYLENDKDNNTSNIYTTTKGNLSSNILLVENMQRVHKINKTEVLLKMDEFVNYCQSIQKKHNNNTDLFSHFTHWMNTNAATPIKKDIETQLNWFMDMFNDISRGTYKPTELIRSLFTKKLNEGFTGPEMAKAVKNLYSNSDKNDWHKRTGYVNATPEFLLKNDNLNKYLNQRF